MNLHNDLTMHILFFAALVLIYFFILRPLFKMQKKMDKIIFMILLIEKIRTSEEFEIAYKELKTSQNSNLMFFLWCLRFSVRLKEIQDEALKKEDKDFQDLEDKHLEDLLNTKPELTKFFASVLNYLTPEEQQMLNSVTDKELGMSIRLDPIDLL